MSNICHNCVYHEKCISYRYNNVRTKYMNKVNIQQNKDGKKVIFVEKCRNFTPRRFKYYPNKKKSFKSIDIKK